MTPPIRVAVADDQALVRSGFLALLRAEDGIDVVGEAANGYEAVALAKTEHPGVLRGFRTVGYAASGVWNSWNASSGVRYPSPECSLR